MHAQSLTPTEQRVLGCLIEKRWTTPDTYPLSLNGLRLACNQSTNRDPVMDLDEDAVREAAQRLCRYGLARLASGHTSRSVKWRHLAEEALGLDRPALAVLAVLLLRGAQTPGELKARSERLCPVGSLKALDAVLERLIEAGYVRQLERRPGQKEERYAQLLGAGGEADGRAPAPVPTPAPAPAPALAPAPIGASVAGSDGLESRVAELEAEIAALRAELAELRSEAPGRRDT